MSHKSESQLMRDIERWNYLIIWLQELKEEKNKDGK